MRIRPATSADLAAMAALAASEQQRPVRHCAYLSESVDAIMDEVEELPDWTAISAVAENQDGLIIGWLVGEIDREVGRVWWLGPVVGPGEGWLHTASLLYDAANPSLPEGISGEEFAVDQAFRELIDWAEAYGFHTEEGSAALVMEADLPASLLRTRPPDASDVDIVGALHDRLFAGTHYTGRQIVFGDPPDPSRTVLVTELGDAPVGYVVAEVQADGSGYIDFLGVEPAHERRGLGSGLILAAAAGLRAAGCARLHLTVREGNTGARALYEGLGFAEERVLVPVRKGFRLS